MWPFSSRKNSFGDATPDRHVAKTNSRRYLIMTMKCDQPRAGARLGLFVSEWEKSKCQNIRWDLSGFDSVRLSHGRDRRFWGGAYAYPDALSGDGASEP
jgi:hypothetical protein